MGTSVESSESQSAVTVVGNLEVTIPCPNPTAPSLHFRATRARRSRASRRSFFWRPPKAGRRRAAAASAPTPPTTPPPTRPHRPMTRWVSNQVSTWAPCEGRGGAVQCSEEENGGEGSVGSSFVRLRTSPPLSCATQKSEASGLKGSGYASPTEVCPALLPSQPIAATSAHL